MRRLTWSQGSSRALLLDRRNASLDLLRPDGFCTGIVRAVKARQEFGCEFGPGIRAQHLWGRTARS
jgi:hypothetical protein